ncbi:MAG: hypothetical protein K1X28_08165 [Parachlamydiales bacterium]|nr:hypothetical protein [Parachlamydiales bacterium]
MTTPPLSPIRPISSSALNSPERPPRQNSKPTEERCINTKPFQGNRVSSVPDETCTDRKTSRVFSDRFIPDRSLLSRPAAQSIMFPPHHSDCATLPYERLLSKTLFGHAQKPDEIPVLRHKTLPEMDISMPTFRKGEIYTQTAERILDLPGLEDNFYSHPIAISSKDDQIGIVLHEMFFTDDAGSEQLGSQIYFYTPQSSKIETLFAPNALCPSNQKPVSVAFSPNGAFLAVGKLDGTLELWKIKSKKRISEFKLGNDPIVSLIFAGNKIFAGDHLGRLFELDPNKPTRYWQAHQADICNIVLSSNGKYLATGGNDNKAIIYDANTMEVLTQFEMGAAIRAIDFDPTGAPRVALGGGEADSRICILDFSDLQKQKIYEIPTGSQVTNILWKKKNRMISTHRDGSYRVYPIEIGRPLPLGNIQKGKIPNPNRILFAALQSQNDTLILGAPETLSFFPMPKEPLPKPQAPGLLDPWGKIR